MHALYMSVQIVESTCLTSALSEQIKLLGTPTIAKIHINNAGKVRSELIFCVLVPQTATSLRLLEDIPCGGRNLVKKLNATRQRTDPAQKPQCASAHAHMPHTVFVTIMLLHVVLPEREDVVAENDTDNPECEFQCQELIVCCQSGGCLTSVTCSTCSAQHTSTIILGY